MSNTKIVEQSLSIIEQMAGNPNSGINLGNIEDATRGMIAMIARSQQLAEELLAGTAPAPAVVAPVAKASAPTPAPAPELKVVEEVRETEAPVVATTKASAVADAAPKRRGRPPKAKPAETATATEEVLSSPQDVSSPSFPTAKSGQTPEEVADAFIEQQGSAAKALEVLSGSDAEGLRGRWLKVVAQRAEQEKIAEDFIAEHGSARAAMEILRDNKRRGRRTIWQKYVEQRADREMREAPKNAKKFSAKQLAAAAVRGKPLPEIVAEKTGYKFAHISRKPFMDPEEAIGSEQLVNLIDGVPKTMMSRYLKTKYNMTPEEYIAHFDLRPDYPMTAEGYRSEKQRLAKVQKLGVGSRKVETAKPEPVVTEVVAEAAAEAPATTRRTRQRKAA